MNPVADACAKRPHHPLGTFVANYRSRYQPARDYRITIFMFLTYIVISKQWNFNYIILMVYEIIYFVSFDFVFA